MSFITRKSATKARSRCDVAVAYKDFGFTDEFWIIDYWHRVEPGKCKLVFSQFYAPNNLFSFQSFPLHLAFAFTDSTGVYGRGQDSARRSGVAASRFHLCVGGENYKYRVNGKDPEAQMSEGRSDSCVDRLGTDAGCVSQCI